MSCPMFILCSGDAVGWHVTLPNVTLRYVTLLYLACLQLIYCIIIPSNEMKVFDWLIKVQCLESYYLANLPKHNIKTDSNKS